MECGAWRDGARWDGTWTDGRGSMGRGEKTWGVGVGWDGLNGRADATAWAVCAAAYASSSSSMICCSSFRCSSAERFTYVRRTGSEGDSRLGLAKSDQDGQVN